MIKNRNQSTWLQSIPILITIIGISLTIISQPKHSNWSAFDESKISYYESNNIAYFIDITAKWCITCQTNKLTVLNNIQLIQADWTNNNPKITQLLKRFNQISIPTYIYYDGQSHTILSNILTKKDIERLFE